MTTIEDPKKELKHITIPLSKEERSHLISQFEKKTGLSLPSDEQLEKAIEEILNCENGEWKRILPEKIIIELEKEPDELKTPSLIHSMSQTIVDYCYQNSKYLTSITLARLFGLCILKTVYVWSKNNYVISFDSDWEEVCLTPYVKTENNENTDWDYYSLAFSSSKKHHRLLSDPLEIICKANFGDKDIEWHNSEFAVVAINAALRVEVETKQDEHEICRFLGYKYYTLIRGKSGAATPARSEYQKMMLRTFGFESNQEKKGK